MNPGILHVVATPIGNLEDMSTRALQVLRQVDLILAEDTRHSARLLAHFAISTPLQAFHEHNERHRVDWACRQLLQGRDLALISDAGTPLISDPGYRLVREAHRHGITVTPVPGPSAVMAALSTAGLPTDRFAFEGFLPARAPARRKRLQALAREVRTLVFLEAPHRLSACLEDMVTVFGADREACLARELTKRYETIRLAPLAELLAWVRVDADQCRGESVLLLAGVPEDAGVEEETSLDVDRLLRALLRRLPVKEAAELAAEASGMRRNTLYRRALVLKESGSSPEEAL